MSSATPTLFHRQSRRGLWPWHGTAPVVPAGLSALLAALVPGTARGAAPLPWQMTLQPAASPVMERLADFHIFLSVIITLIVLAVLGMMAYVMIRFNAKAHPVPSTRTHHTWLEVVWTVIPVLILAVIAVPSFRTLFYLDRIEKADMTLKVIGHQWYWSYAYPDQGDFTFNSMMLADSEIKPGQPRLLEVDERIVLPVDTTVRVLISAEDVIHSFAVPAFGIKLDAVPGRVNETWLRATETGVFYGQCSQLCGVNHAYMPVAIEVVGHDAFARWIEDKKRQAATPSPDRSRIAVLNAPRPTEPQRDTP